MLTRLNRLISSTTRFLEIKHICVLNVLCVNNSVSISAWIIVPVPIRMNMNTKWSCSYKKQWIGNKVYTFMEIYNEAEQHHSANEGFKPTTIRSPRQ
jgi:hypothetical protein